MFNKPSLILLFEIINIVTRFNFYENIRMPMVKNRYKVNACDASTQYGSRNVSPCNLLEMARPITISRNSRFSSESNHFYLRIAWPSQLGVIWSSTRTNSVLTNNIHNSNKHKVFKKVESIFFLEPQSVTKVNNQKGTI